tara:strand:- start:641 stop:967 length:327 start_codon:yes stop_codon:yes gene_type:complete
MLLSEEPEGYVSILDEPTPKRHSNPPSHAPQYKSEATDSKPIGIALMLFGICVALGYFIIYDTSVDSGDSKVNNFGKLNNQSNGITIGMGLAIVGSVLYAGGRIEEKR